MSISKSPRSNHYQGTGDREALGKLIRHIRESRKFRRADVIARYQTELGKIDPDFDFREVISDAWLSRLEKGLISDIEPRKLHLLCRALDCTPIQQMEVMVRADRNAMTNHDGEITEDLLAVMWFAKSLYANPDIRRISKQFMKNRRFFELTETDRALIVNAMFDVMRRTDAELLREDQQTTQEYGDTNGQYSGDEGTLSDITSSTSQFDQMAGDQEE